MSGTPMSTKPETLEDRFMWLLNPLMRGILRSPLHGLQSSQTLILTFTGRKSGKQYSTPLSYTRHGNLLRCFTSHENKWWRNLQRDTPVSLIYKGRRVQGTATVLVDDHQHIADRLAEHVQQVPRDVKFHGIGWDAPQRPNMDDVLRAAQRLVMITIVIES
ncbi:MAG: nitroreductase/quinone reductase family protein [Chloroflexota bacterium]